MQGFVTEKLEIANASLGLPATPANEARVLQIALATEYAALLVTYPCTKDPTMTPPLYLPATALVPRTTTGTRIPFNSANATRVSSEQTAHSVRIISTSSTIKIYSLNRPRVSSPQLCAQKVTIRSPSIKIIAPSSSVWQPHPSPSWTES